MRALLIRGATFLDGAAGDVLVRDGRIAAIGVGITACDAAVVEAHGGTLLPGLHDHHIHLAATAAAMVSVRCGPPAVRDAAGLAAALAVPGTGWLRGTGYHESVAGEIDRRWLDAVAPARPVRVQHRSGRLWILNSLAVAAVLATGAPPAGLDVSSGRLLDEDAWLRRALGGTPPDLAPVGTALAGYGVTGVTDMTPGNDDRAAAWLETLPQRVLLFGGEQLTRGGLKIHLREAALPDFYETVAAVARAHAAGRAVAVHCVTETELVFTLAALREAGVSPGDRIEHASITPEALVAEIAALGLAVVAQPHFVAERGDAYLQDVPPADWPNLYRLRGFATAGVALAAGSDAPFGGLDPWAAIRAAVARRTEAGASIGAAEALTPEEGLKMFLKAPGDLARMRTVAVGAPADLVLLDRPWAEARTRLEAADVRLTMIGGAVVHDRVDQSQAERLGRTEAAA